MLRKFASRKLFAFVAGVGVVLAAGAAGVPAATIYAITGLVGSYLAAQGAADAAAAFKAGAQAAKDAPK